MLGVDQTQGSVQAQRASYEPRRQPLTETSLTVRVGLKVTSVTRKVAQLETTRQILKQEAGGKRAGKQREERKREREKW